MKRFLISAAMILSSGATAAYAQGLDDSLFMGGLTGAKLKKAVQKAENHPLGSDKNPVRVDMPMGQKAYLSRLRCEDGKAPKFSRGGSTGAGPFGSIVDVYDVDCGGAGPGKVSVYMDMYHPIHKESRAVPGFTISE